MRIDLWFLTKLWSSRSFLCLHLIAGTLAAILSLSSCGGGASSSPPPPPPPPPDFSLSVEVQTVTIQQQGAYQFQTTQVNPLHGFNAAVSITISALPAGVTMTPPGPFSLPGSPQNQGVSFQMSASTAATVGSTQLAVTATSGSITRTANFSVAVTAIAPFTIQVSPTAVSIGPAAYQAVQISETAAPGTSPALQTNFSELPVNSGINLAPPQSVLTPTNPVNFTVEAGVLAQALQSFPIVVTASDNNGNSSVAVVPLTISVPAPTLIPTRSTFVRTDQSPTGVVYDPARKLLFVSVEILNEVVVLSSVDGHRVATIPVPYPAGIDEAVDGSAVYVVSPYFSYITTIDPHLLEVVQRTDLPQISSLIQTGFQIATLSNGNVMILLASQDSNGPPIYLWNPSNNAFSGLGNQAFQNWQVGIARAADHSKVLIQGNTSYIYDTAHNFLSGPLNFGGGYQAISPDGSQIVGASLQNSPTVFYDAQGNAQGSIALSILRTEGALYSLDGSRVYVLENDLFSTDNVAAVIDTKTFSLLGVVSGFSFGAALPFSGAVNTEFAIDETDMIFGPAFRGIGYLDVSSSGFLNLPLSTVALMSPTLMSPSSSTQAQLSGAYFSLQRSYGAYFGAPPASPLTLAGTNLQVVNSNILNLSVPASTNKGPANMTLTSSDGSFQVIPDAVSYRPTVLQVDANAGSPSGGDSITVVGYGFDGSNVLVTVGGKSVTNQQLHTAISGQLFPTESLTLTTPAGSPGYADITISSVDGSTTIAGGFQYLNSVQLYPITGALDDIVYDPVRQRLYVTNQDHNRVEIFDLSTQKFLSPIPMGNQPTSLALTPDDARLGVINFADATMSVIDPGALQVLATFTVVPSQDTGCNVPINMSPVAPHRMLLNLACPGTLDGGTFHLVNLDTGSLSCTGVAGCESNGTDMAFGYCCGLGATASTPDGSKVFLASEVGGSVGMLDLAANILTFGFSGTFTDAAASADGNVFAASFGISNAKLSQSSSMAFEPYANSGNQSILPPGEKLNPSGSLLFVPQSSAVAIFDVHTGRMAQRVAISDGIPQDTGAMALDETGTKMFLISNSGITIAQLFQAPLSLASPNPIAGSQGTQVTLRGSGFLNGATVLFGTLQAATTYVDAETLTAIVPTMSAGPVRITVKNPGGQTYSFDDAFTVQ